MKKEAGRKGGWGGGSCSILRVVGFGGPAIFTFRMYVAYPGQSRLSKGGAGSRVTVSCEVSRLRSRNVKVLKWSDEEENEEEEESTISHSHLPEGTGARYKTSKNNFLRAFSKVGSSLPPSVLLNFDLALILVRSSRSSSTVRMEFLGVWT